VGADDEDVNAPPPEKLTALGHHLAALPVDVRIGKLLILGAAAVARTPAGSIRV
jgi:ATP-dependent RNA helicase DHX57